MRGKFPFNQKVEIIRKRPKSKDKKEVKKPTVIDITTDGKVQMIVIINPKEEK